MFRCLILIILLWSGPAYGAAITSKVVGTTGTPALASVATNWVGDVAPVDGDTVIIASGAVIIQDVNRTYGNNGSAVGHAVTINGTNSTTYGTLRVADGVALTLRGYDTTNNTLMRVNQYAIFEPLPGATIVGDVAGDYTSIIDNRGIISAIGTAVKPITFTSPSGAYSWNNSVASEAFSGTAWKYDPNNKIAAVAFTQKRISNAAGTGIGQNGDSSIAFSGKSPASILSVEVATLDQVTSAGTYYVDYDMGVVWFYHDPAAGNPSFTKAYKYLTIIKTWGVSSIQNTTHNEAKFEYCNFAYLGKTDGSDPNRVLAVQYKKSTTVAANRLFSLKNSTFTYCASSVGIKNCDGTPEDPLEIAGNTFSDGVAVTFYRANSSYVSFTGNTCKTASGPVISIAAYDPVEVTGLKVNNNNVLIAGSFVQAVSLLATLPNSEIKNNIIRGVGSAKDYRAIQSSGGTAGNPLVVADNLFSEVLRGVHYASYLTFTGNRLVNVFHHGFVGPVEDDLKINDITVAGNVWVGEPTGSVTYDLSPNIEMGYNHRMWLDNITVLNNTMVGNPSGGFGFGDMQDSGTYTLATRLTVRNNLVKRISSGTQAFGRRALSTSSIWRGHVSQFDYNLDHGYASRYSGAPTLSQGSFVGIINVAGVALWSPSFSTKSSGSITLVHAGATNRTLAWGSGTPVQLVLDSGIATAAAQNTTGSVAGLYSGTLTDTSKSYTTTKNDVNCPLGHWVVITGGTGVGQIRAITNNTATVLTVAPGWAIVPDATSTYAIIKAEVTLTDGVESVQAGIYLPDLPTSSQTDTGISFADHSITGQNPLLSNPAGLTFADMVPANNSPVIGAGYGGTHIGAVAPQSTSAPNGTQRKRTFGFGFSW